MIARPEPGEPGFVDWGEGLSVGLSLFAGHFAPLALIGLVFGCIELGIALLQQIPILGVLVWIVVPFTIEPVINAGFFVAALRFHDGDAGRVDDLFGEFRSLGDLALLMLVRVGIWLAALIPIAGVGAVAFVPVMTAMENDPAYEPQLWEWIVMGVAGAMVVLAFVMINLILLWSYPALVDRRAGFLDAIKTSWKISRNTPFATLVIAVVAVILGYIGLVACGFGYVLTIPAYFCIVCASYRTAVLGSAQPVSYQ